MPPPASSSSSPSSSSSSSSSALLIIDVQNDFLPPSGSLAVPEGKEVLPIIRGLLEGDWLGGVWDIVVASQDWHPPTHISFSSHHKHPHAARPFTTVRVPRGTLGEHVDIHSSTASTSTGSSPEQEQEQGNRDGNGDEGDGLAAHQQQQQEGQAGEELSDPRRGYQHVQGVDDGQVDLNLWPDHCVKDTKGAEIEEDLRTALRPWHRAGKFALVRKGMQSDIEAFSAFSGSVVPITSPELDKALGGPFGNGNGNGNGSGAVHEQASQGEKQGENLADYLIKLGVGKICVVGLATDFCVAQTALAAMNRESSPFAVYLYEPAVRGVGKDSSDKALRVCTDRGIKILHNEQELKEVFGGFGI